MPKFENVTVKFVKSSKSQTKKDWDVFEVSIKTALNPVSIYFVSQKGTKRYKVGQPIKLKVLEITEESANKPALLVNAE
jgi:hypothetical protein